MFNNFKDYDAYAFYAANRLYFALRKNYWNQGKIIKGKEIRPIKSCLNYTKALLYPMKVEYQRETFNEIISEEFASKKFDMLNFKEHITNSVKSTEGVDEMFKHYLHGSFSKVSGLIDEVLQQSPFVPQSQDIKKLKISILLNTLYSIKIKHKLDSEIPTIILWRLPKSISTYMRILLKEFYTRVKLEIVECYSEVDIDDATVSKLLSENVEVPDYEE